MAAADAASRSAVSWLLRRSEIMAPVVVDLKWGKMGRKGKNGKKRAPQCGRETELIGIRSSRFHRLNLAFLWKILRPLCGHFPSPLLRLLLCNIDINHDGWGAENKKEGGGGGGGGGGKVLEFFVSLLAMV